jgi:hypothetical protein
MVATAYLDFKDATTTFPWIRAGALAVNLSSPICKDGMGKLLVKSDLEKLKHQTQRPQLLIAEKALQVNYELLQKAGKHQSPPGLSTMGRALVRTLLFLTKFLQEIANAFGEECMALDNGSLPAAPAVGHDKTTIGTPASLQEQFMNASHGSTQCLCWSLFSLLFLSESIFCGRRLLTLPRLPWTGLAWS